jgi:hypothetical protein
MKYKSRREFLLKYALVTGSALFPIMSFPACKGPDDIVEEVDDEQDEELGDEPGNEPGVELIIPEVIDKQIWFIDDTYNTTYRTITSDPDFRYYSGFPAIPRVQSVPFEWGTENFYSGNGGYITDNVYCEPVKSMVVQLVISTPGEGDTATGSPQYKVWYRVSPNRGKTFTPLKQVIIDGYTSMNPIEGVVIGRNGFNVDFTRPIVKASNGEIIVPVCLHPWDDENQKIYLPVSNAFLFQDAGALIGKWLPDGSDIKWEFGGWLRIDHNKSTRGLSEPTIVETNENGKFAMVTRCSNTGRPELPGYAWVSFSNDYCRTWSEPRPFTYSNGENFFAPTAHSTLIKLRKSGRVYWIGNINDKNPNGSHPRYPLAIGEVDLKTFGLIKETVVILDTRHEHEGLKVQLSNFKVMENAEKEEIIVVCTRRDGSQSAKHSSWYRVKL